MIEREHRLPGLYWMAAQNMPLGYCDSYQQGQRNMSDFERQMHALRNYKPRRFVEIKVKKLKMYVYGSQEQRLATMLEF